MADLTVFISYRRSDASGDAGRLYDALRRRFGRDSVFMDVDSVRPGEDWVNSIDRSVEGCDVLLAVIGPDWADVRDESGQRRLEDEADHVRLEIEAALAAEKPVIPLLVDDAPLPRRAQLPKSLQPLLRHQAYRLSHTTYGADVQGLVRALRELKRLAPAEQPPVAARPPVAAPPPVAPPPPVTASAPLAPTPIVQSPPPDWWQHAQPAQPAATPPASPRPLPYPARSTGVKAYRSVVIAVVGMLALAALIIGAVAFASMGGHATPTPASTPTSAPTFGPSAPPVTPSGVIGHEVTVKVGVDMPLSGAAAADAQAMVNGVQLAVDEFNAKAAGSGITAEVFALDDAVAGNPNTDQGAMNMTALVHDPAVLGVVGPYTSTIARNQIPISNQAGLAQCSPTNVAPELTQDGSDRFRYNGQATRNYFRVAAPNNVQAKAMASFDRTVLGRSKAYVIDDGTPASILMADSFTSGFEQLGGTIARRDSAPSGSSDFGALFGSAQAAYPDVVYFAGILATDAAQARSAMMAAGMGGLPFTVSDSVADRLPGGTSGAFITAVGLAGSDHIYGTSPLARDLAAGSSFNTDYQQRFGAAPGRYGAAAYACAQVLLTAIEDSALTTTGDFGPWREAVRAYVLDDAQAHSYTTPFGEISFNSNGDIEQPVVSFYQVDPTANGGTGDWKFVRQEIFQP